jgi:rhamnulose-1-phosphate aldolase/alcohol dehydrogenase
VPPPVCCIGEAERGVEPGAERRSGSGTGLRRRLRGARQGEAARRPAVSGPPPARVERPPADGARHGAMLRRPMKSRWTDAGANQAIERWRDCGEDLALRLYTSRLIGSDPELVLHGGGNTSLETMRPDLLGEPQEVLFVKGSGATLDAVEPRDLPGLRLAGLRRLRALPALTDEEMVNQLRVHLLDAYSPNPSVETLLHAFLPHRYVDHSHADAVLALTNQPHGAELVREALGKRVAVLPWIMPGFPLALAVAQAVEGSPHVEGVVLLKHGLFTFAETARESYERHVELVDLCEQTLARRAGGRASPAARPVSAPCDTAGCKERVSRAAPILRGLLAEATGDEDRPWRRVVLCWRGGADVLAFCAREEAARLAAEGPLTPDHVIRTKPLPLFLPDPAWDDDARLAAQLAEAVGAYRRAYEAYFQENVRAKGVVRTCLDSGPRVVLLPGAGALCFGPTQRAARIAADITEHTLRAKILAEAAGRYEGLALSELFDMEYWSLEQAKLGQAPEGPLSGQVVLVTGGAGAVGLGIAEACAAAGAHLVLVDLDAQRVRDAAARIEAAHGSGTAVGLQGDVTDEASLRAAFDAACVAHGGVDVVVPNAGVAWVAPIEELDLASARRVADVNYLGVLATLRQAARIFRRQRTGGHVVVNASKNVLAPGADFGAYSASKAAAAQIAKVAAIELAPLGVRVNIVHADAIFEEAGVASGLWQTVGPERARRRGLAPEELPEHYRQRSLLKTRVRARHVGAAVVFFASQQTPTTGASLPVDGGIPEAFPR